MAFNSVVGGLDGAVFATAVAICFNIALVAASALPEHVVRSEINLTFEALLEWGEIFNKINSAIT